MVQNFFEEYLMTNTQVQLVGTVVKDDSKIFIESIQVKDSKCATGSLIIFVIL